MKVLHSIRDYEEVISGFHGQTIVLKAGAVWCKPCHEIQPLYEKIAEHVESVAPALFVAFDIDKIPELTEMFDITSVPSFVCKIGDETCKHKGSEPAKLVKWIEHCLGVSLKKFRK
jgi:thioredoxin 1